jgi:hypothetical protein
LAELKNSFFLNAHFGFLFQKEKKKRHPDENQAVSSKDGFEFL